MDYRFRFVTAIVVLAVISLFRADARVIEVSRDSVVFSCTLPGETGFVLVRIENKAGITLNGVQVITPHNPFLVTGVPTTPFNISAGGHEDLFIRFIPDRPGSWVDSIGIVAGGEVKLVRLRGESTATPRVLGSPLLFGDVGLADSVIDTLRFGNSGCRDLIVLAGTIAGSSDFTVLAGPVFPDTLRTGERHTYVVAYTPTTLGRASATAILQTRYRLSGSDVNGVDTTLRFEGRGVLRGLIIRPDSLDFDSVSVLASPPSMSLSIRNADNPDITVNSIVLSGRNAAEFVIAHTATPFVLAGRLGGSDPDSTAIDVSFHPISPGNRIASVQIATSAGDFDIPLRGYGISPPNVEVTPHKIDFGSIMVGTSSSLTDTISVANLSVGQSVTVDSVTVTGPDAAAYVVSPVTAVIDEGMSARFSVAFAPQHIGRSDARADFYLSSRERLTVDFEGTGLPPGLLVTPRRLDFPATPVFGLRGPLSLRIVNLGPAAATIDTIELSGGDVGQFELGQRSYPVVLRGDGLDTLKLPVWFAPVAIGTMTSRVIVHADGATEIVFVRGEGLSDGPVIAPRPLDFGDVAVGVSRTLADTLQVRNPVSASGALRIDSASMSGADAATFSIAGPASVVLNPGESALYTVSFLPDAARRFTARPLIHFSDGFAARSTVTGRGISPGVSVEPDEVIFAPRALGTTSPEEKVEIRNLTSVQRRIDSVVVGGINAGDFATTRNDGTAIGAVGANDRWSAWVTFTPSVAGARVGALDVYFEGGEISHVPLRGTGVIAGLTVQPDTVQFGRVYVDTTATKRGGIVLMNGGLASVTVSSAHVEGPDRVSFAATLSGGPQVVVPGGSVEVDLSFTPRQERDYQAETVLTVDGAGEVRIPTLGTGYAATTYMIRLDTLTTQVGIERTMVATIIPPLTISDGVTGFAAQLVVPRVSLHILRARPDGVTFALLPADTVAVSFSGGAPISGAELFRIDFEGLVSGHAFNPVDVTDIQFTGGDLLPRASGGLVILTGCEIVHSEAFGRPARVIGITPNPMTTHGRIRYRAPSGMSPAVAIVDAFGNVVRIMDLDAGTDQEQEAEIELGDIHPGFYLVELRLGSQRSSLPMILNR